MRAQEYSAYDSIVLYAQGVDNDLSILLKGISRYTYKIVFLFRSPQCDREWDDVTKYGFLPTNNIFVPHGKPHRL